MSNFLVRKYYGAAVQSSYRNEVVKVYSLIYEGVRKYFKINRSAELLIFTDSIDCISMLDNDIPRAGQYDLFLSYIK